MFFRLTFDSKQFADTYEEAQSNYLTREVLQYLCNRPPEATQDDVNRSEVELRARLYTVGVQKNDKKALEATETIFTDEPIAEYKGRVILKKDFDLEHNFFERFVST